MADPTIKDVLKLLEAGFARLDAKVDGLKNEMHKRFDDLDDELDKHSAVTHRKIDAEIAALKKRANPPRTVRASRRR